MDWTINIPTLMGVIAPGIGVVIWLARVGERVATNAVHIEELQQHKENEHRDIRLEIAAVKAQVSILGERLNDIRLEAARSYVTHEALINIERKVIEEIQRMEKRLEAQLDRAIEGSRQK
ncbi:MAG: hypothetical protein K0R85_243 [Devosia sp.]|jgi:hypothetical protein|nr:hypothetical protein [Devosia sp.]